ncbi:MAG: contact-dependent growth inhibition system immunity protein [Nocardioides sp.]
MSPASQPALELLSGTYFHQDWDVTARDEWGVVDRFVAECPDVASQLPAEVAAVLAAYPDEHDLDDLMDSWGCEFVPPSSEGGYLAWLPRVAERVTRRLRESDG